ncbi:hypothetical protein BD410DRAFT_766456 [Rickenella mellea]|uniref:separase n=1 Tax=Rickenella mellea TaxID=50990 RepID=A0A4Y7QCE1_9AGAM|nr:hypothetical protein BD410DRAFT_766456 [Rickenella mellea]
MDSTSTRKPANPRPTRTARVNADDLADRFAAGVKISDVSTATRSRPKTTTKAASTRTPEEKKAAAMVSVNTASQSLSTIVQSEWKASSPKKGTGQTVSSVATLAKTAQDALAGLRAMGANALDVERSASSVIGKLVAIEMFDHALELLRDMRGPLLTLLELEDNVASAGPAPRARTSSSINQAVSHIFLISLPIPTDSTCLDAVRQSLVSSYLSHTLTVISNLIAPHTTSHKVFLETLLKPGSIISWISFLSALPAKTLDSALKRAYISITSSFSSPPTSSLTLVQLRFFALQYLLLATPLESTPFWEQTLKYASAYVKNIAGSDEVTATQVLLDLFDGVVTVAETRNDSPSTQAGKGWVSFCEYWMALARRANDARLLSRVARYIQTSPSSSAPTAAGDTPSDVPKSDMKGSPSGLDSEGRLLQVAKACATFAQTTVLLEHITSDITMPDADELYKCADSSHALLRQCNHFLVGDSDDSKTSGQSKLRRAIEKLRRAALKVLTSSCGTHDVLKVTRSLLENVVTTYQSVLQTECGRRSDQSDLRVPTLDTLFNLATTKLSPTDPDTWGQAFEYLSTSLGVIGSSDDETAPSRDNIDEANFVRCISGAFFNIAGTLYKAGKFAPAVRFLTKACPLGKRAIELYLADTKGKSPSLGDVAGAKEADAWIQLKAQLYKRWELLGVCYSKIGDRKLAYESFVESIKHYPFGEVEKHVQVTPSVNVFSLQSYQQIGSMIDRLTYIGAADLFLHRGVSLLEPLRTGGVPTCCIGAVLERQILGLDSSKWKPAIQEVIRALLDDLLLVYGSEYPIRRAKAMVKSLEHAYFSDPMSLHADEIGEDIIRLLSAEDHGQDANLASLSPQYQAWSHLWLALHSHGQGVSCNNDGVLRHASHAYTVLAKTLVMSEATPKKSPRRSSTAHGQKTKATSKGAAVPPKVRSTRGTRKKEPVTPKKKAAALHPTRTQPNSAAASTIDAFDDFDAFAVLMHTVAHLLGLMGHVFVKMQLLGVLRRLCTKHNGKICEAYMRASVELGHELMKVGKIELAASVFAHLVSTIRGQGEEKISEELKVYVFLRYSEVQALIGNVPKSVALYCEALSLSESLKPEDKVGSVSERIRQRVVVLKRIALAASVFATIQYARDDANASLEGLLHALRLFNRASETLQKLSPPPIKSPQAADTNNPFDMSSLDDALTPNSSPKDVGTLSEKPTYDKTSLDGLEWRIADGLLTTLLSLSQGYLTRGSSREAEYFAQQAETLADSLRIPAMASRALSRKSEVLLRLGQLDNLNSNLVKALTLLKEVPGTDAAEARRLKGDYCYKDRRDKDAKNMYTEAIAMLGELEERFGTLENMSPASPRRSSLTSPRSPKALAKQDMFAPIIVAHILRQQIWLHRDDAGDEYEQLLKKFLALPGSADILAETNALLGRLALHDIHGRFSADMFLSSLTESTIALPMGMSSERTSAQPAPPHEILAALSHAETLFETGLMSFARRGHVANVREAAVSLALVKAFQNSLGKVTKHSPVVAATLLDIASSVTLRREMIETIPRKFEHMQRQDDMAWPVMSTDGSPIVVTQPSRNPRFDDSMEIDEDDSSISGDAATRTYWEFILQKYQAQNFDVSSLTISETDQLPHNWVVVSIGVTEDKSTLLVSRQRPRHEPQIFCVPLKGRRDSDEDGQLTFDDALKELKDIIRASDDGTRRAVDINADDKEGKTAWWAERKLLDQRLKELLENIEFCWLGAFKTILSTPMKMPPDIIPALRTRFEKVFKPIVGAHDKKLKTRLKLDDGLLECFAALSPTCRDEELEDLVYFVLDLYHFHGVRIALAEVDVDQVVVDLRTTLEEHHARVRGRIVAEQDSHMFLVLDKNVQGIPWESIPILRGRSVSRIPSVSFLIDRLQLARCERGLSLEIPTSGCEERVDRTKVDPSRAYYVLNPSGDLPGTEGRFAGWVKEMEQVGWEGVVGHQPSEQQLLNALERKDLVVYFGHGGAEQYVRSHKIRHLRRCAATMLWGCSSGALRDMGDFDRVGTPYNYMLAGCPTLVANLWDVTDRDIDKFSLSVFDKLHLKASEIKKSRNDQKKKEDGVSVIAAVAQARESCKLKYLTGAAPIVYGIPFYL